MASHESRVNLLAADRPLQPDTDLEAGGISGQINPEVRRQGNSITSYLENSSHPVAVIFFLLFRTGALLTYIFGSWFSDNFVFIFVLTVLMLAFDFWTVKNVSGRLLVGLRWWSEVKEDGSTHWVFESRSPNRGLNAADSRIFWTVIYATPLLWFFFAFTAFFTGKWSWLLIVVVALTLNFANVYGYTQCDKDAKKRWATGLATNSLLGGGIIGQAGGFVSGLMGNRVNRFFSGGSG